MYKNSALFILILLLVYASPLLAQEQASWPATHLTLEERTWLKEHPLLRVSSEPDYAPIDFQIDGKPAGYSIDYVKLLAERLDIKLEFVQESWANLLEKAKRRELDIIHTIFNTPKEREEYLHFTKPYKETVNGIITSSETTDILSLDDIAERKVALVKGDSASDVLQQLYPEIKAVEVENYKEALKAVAFGSADATITELPLANYLIRSLLLTNLKIAAELPPLGGRDQHFRLAVRKDWPELIPILEKAMDSLTQQELNELDNRWFTALSAKDGKASPVITFTVEEKQFVAAQKPLRFSEVAWEPLSIVDNLKKFDGLIADYFNIIRQKSGLRFAFQKSETWVDVLEKYAAQKIDIVPALSKGDEVGRDILLSEPFVSFPLVIVTQNDVSYITETAKLNGKSVAVGRGYTSYHYLKNNYPDVNLVEVANVREGLLKVSNDEVFAFVGHLAVAVNHLQKMGLKNLKIAGETNFEFEHRIGVDPKFPTAVAIINKVLANMTEQEHLAIYQKWLPVEFKKSVDYSLVWKIILIIVFIAVSILTVIFSWNRSLAEEIIERKKIEQEYLASERKIMAMSRAVEDALVMLDGQGKVRFWNPAAVKMFGYTIEEAMDMDFLEMAVPEDIRDKAWAGLSHFAKTGQGKVIGGTVEDIARNRQGVEFPVEITVAYFQIDDEWFAVGTVRNITARKNAVEEMQQNLEDLKQFSNVAIGREEKMIQLKEEINDLLVKTGKEKKYKIVE